MIDVADSLFLLVQIFFVDLLLGVHSSPIPVTARPRPA